MLPWTSDLADPSRLADVRDTPLSELVRDDVLAMILRGELPIGSRINEPDIAQRLGVSRVPVREALRALESSGLVVARKHAGVFVREPDQDEVRGLYDLRGLLDGYAGRCAARLPQGPRNALTDALDASVLAMRGAVDAQDIHAYYGENLRFHWLIVEAAGNGPVSEAYRGLVQKLHLWRLKNLSQGMGRQASIAEHTAIAAAIRAGDADTGERLLVRHVRSAFDRLTDALV